MDASRLALRLASISLLCLSGSKCRREVVTEPFPPPTPIVIAHRGASAVAPEHTLAAYDRAVDQRADYIELDVQRTRDGALVVVHDAELDRTARGASPDCSGPVADKTLIQIESCDAGSWFNASNPALARQEFIGLKIPTLAAVIARYGSKTRLYIETKDPDSYPGIEVDLTALLRKEGIRAGSRTTPRVFIQSFSRESLERVHSLDSSLPLVQLFDAMNAADMIARLPEVARYATAIGPRKDDVTAALVDAAHARCILVHPYTVDDTPGMLSLLAMGVDGIFTNRPDLLREIIDREVSRMAGDNGCAAVARQTLYSPSSR